MSRKYKFHNPEGVYFISFAVVYWIDVFTRKAYQDIIIESLKFCQSEKGMEIYAWCLMSSHMHLIFRSTNNKPSDVLRDFKTFTSKKIQKAIAENPQESRKEWMLSMFKKAGSEKSNISYSQFWQQHNKPIELWSNDVIDQKVNYTHNNPVEAGLILNAWDWRLSSAIDYADGKGLVEIKCLL